MTTGPPPKMMVPARVMLARRSRGRGGEVRTPRRIMSVVNDAVCLIISAVVEK